MELNVTSNLIDTSAPPPPPPGDPEDRRTILIDEMLAKIGAGSFINAHLQYISFYRGFYASFDVSAIVREYNSKFKAQGIGETDWQNRLRHRLESFGYRVELGIKTRLIRRSKSGTLSLDALFSEAPMSTNLPVSTIFKNAQEAIEFANKCKGSVLKTHLDRCEREHAASPSELAIVDISSLRGEISLSGKATMSIDAHSILADLTAALESRGFTVLSRPDRLIYGQRERTLIISKAKTS